VPSPPQYIAWVLQCVAVCCKCIESCLDVDDLVPCFHAVCYSVLQRGVVCCSVLNLVQTQMPRYPAPPQCVAGVAVCCSVVQCGAVCCSVLQYVTVCGAVCSLTWLCALCCSVSQSVTVCITVCITVCVTLRVIACRPRWLGALLLCSVLQCITVECSVLQCGDDDDYFYYHSWRNNVVIAFGTLQCVLQCVL